MGLFVFLGFLGAFFAVVVHYFKSGAEIGLLHSVGRMNASRQES